MNTPNSPLLLRLVLGSISGIVATGPMTAAMILMHRRLPDEERYPLPPREITMKLAEQAGVQDGLDADARSAATVAAHFGYGAACGLLYALGERKVNAPAAAKSLGFGLIVWTVSYLGLMPVMGVLRPATEHPLRRSALMIAAHLVWGAAMGALFHLFAGESSADPRAPLSSGSTPHRDVQGRKRAA